MINYICAVNQEVLAKSSSKVKKVAGLIQTIITNYYLFNFIYYENLESDYYFEFYQSNIKYIFDLS